MKTTPTINLTTFRNMLMWVTFHLLAWNAGAHDAVSAVSSSGGFPPSPPASHASHGGDPHFSEPIKNVTVPLGREATLSCAVTDLDHYKVGWLRVEDQTILTLHTKVVTHNARISVSHDTERTWQLHIRQVKETDRGCYMCQINTSVMKKQVGCVDVHVPPDISDAETSSDVTVQEGDNATLVCRAKGHPSPRILWRREDSESLLFKKASREVTKVDTYSGEMLSLVRVERRQLGAYLCIASNDVPPAVSKRITLNINFAPVVKVPNQLLGAPLGPDVQLECSVEAYPNTINYWVKNRGEMLLNGKKHLIEEERSAYKVRLRLTIRTFGKRDLGTYMCVATNSLGRADGTIRLYEIKVPVHTTTAPTETPSPTMPDEATSQRPEADFAQDIDVSTLAPLQSPIGKTTTVAQEQHYEMSQESSGAQRWALITTAALAAVVAYISS